MIIIIIINSVDSMVSVKLLTKVKLAVSHSNIHLIQSWFKLCSLIYQQALPFGLLNCMSLSESRQ